MRRRHRTFATFQAQVQAPAIVARGADRQRLLAPFGKFAQGPSAVDIKANAQALARFRQDFQRHFG